MKKFYWSCLAVFLCLFGVGLYFLVANLSTPPNEDPPEIEEPEPEDEFYLTTAYSEINVSIDETEAVITFSIYPTNLIPTVSIEDTSILSVNNFIITPLKVGLTKITLTHPNANISKEITVNIFQPEINLSLNSNELVSGDNSQYSAEITSNFEIVNPIINLSDNIEVISNIKEKFKITLNFKILNGTSIRFLINISNLTIDKEFACSEFVPPTPPEGGGTGNGGTGDGSGGAGGETPETYSYVLFYNGVEVSSELNVQFSGTMIFVLTYKVVNSGGQEVNFTSTTSIEDNSGIIVAGSKNDDYKQLSFVVSKQGEITITLTSITFNITKELRVNFT